MSQWLLAAEADKIQDFLFRASKLREVVGGSQLLTRFCQEGAEALFKKKGYTEAQIRERLITANGGGFRLSFDDEEQARSFGADLAELYRLSVNGSLTVAEPVAYVDFPTASEMANQALRRAKQTRPGRQTPQRLPYSAICVSCGITLAQDYAPERLKGDSDTASNPSNYVCMACLTKRIERDTPREGQFLPNFEREVKTVSGTPTLTDQKKWISTPEEIESFDRRGYVAYLLADGNGMGKLFGQCQNPQQMKRFSNALEQTVRAALAEPTVKLMKQKGSEAAKTAGLIPVLPLILGGDDLFALLPAPWALDFARRFCLEYETKMQQMLARDDINLKPEQPPTIAAAVVICKSHYPYQLAHQVGESLLKAAKQTAKVAAIQTGMVSSLINFTVIQGSQLNPDNENSPNFRPSLAPYWAQDNISEEMSRWAVPISTILNARSDLIHLPTRRRARLRELFHQDRPQRENDVEPWMRELSYLLNRIGREAPPESDEEESREIPLRKRVEYWLEQLGAKIQAGKDNYWRQKTYLDGSIQIGQGHGLPDMLDAWDYTYNLDKTMSDYQP